MLDPRLKDKVFVHYGADRVPDPFREAEPHEWMKPVGGFWASPEDSGWGWKQWCEAEQFNVSGNEAYWARRFRFRVAEKARIFIIDSLKDLKRLPFSKSRTGMHPDWKTILQEWDGIFLTDRGQMETRFSSPSLYGWDIESIVLFRSSPIVPVE